MATKDSIGRKAAMALLGRRYRSAGRKKAEKKTAEIEAANPELFQTTRTKETRSRLAQAGITAKDMPTDAEREAERKRRQGKK